MGESLEGQDRTCFEGYNKLQPVSEKRYRNKSLVFLLQQVEMKSPPFESEPDIATHLQQQTLVDKTIRKDRSRKSLLLTLCTLRITWFGERQKSSHKVPPVHVKSHQGLPSNSCISWSAVGIGSPSPGQAFRQLKHRPTFFFSTIL